MADLQFTPPTFVQPKDYSSLPKSIDDLFTAYGRGKARAQELQLGQAQLGAAQTQQQAAAAQLEASRFQEGQATGGYGYKALNDPSVVAFASQPAPTLQAPGPSQTQGVDPQQSPEARIIAFRRGLLEAQQRNIKNEQDTKSAGLLEAQGKARTANQEADMLGAPTLPGQAQTAGAQGGSTLLDNVFNAVKSGNMSPNQADDYLGRNPKVHLAYINKLAENRLNVAALQNQYDKSKTTANFEGGPAVQEASRLVNSINAVLPGLTDLAKKAGVGEYPIKNSISLGIGRQTGSAAVQDYKTKLGEIRAQIAQVLQAHGAPTESAVNRSNELLPDDIGLSQLEKVSKETIPELLTARTQALQGKPVTKNIGLDSNPQALKIKADFHSGKITREAARAALGALK